MIRLVRALYFSLQGIFLAIKHETAFLQECLILILVIPAAFWLTDVTYERLLLISSWVLVMIVELLNSGLEAICDEVTQEHKERIKKAKDYGSASVFLTIVFSASAWLTILLPKYW